MQTDSSRSGSVACRVRIEGYEFDLGRVVDALRQYTPEYMVLEAPQGFIKFLPIILENIEACTKNSLSVKPVIRIEPAYGLCSLSINHAYIPLDKSIIVHIGHDYYPYPLCTLASCTDWRKAERVTVVAGEYVEGDPGKIADRINSLELKRIVLGYTTQYRSIAREVSRILQVHGSVKVLGLEPVVGCFYENFRKYRGQAEGYVVVAGGYFHGLGLGLYFKGEEHVYAVDPHTTNFYELDSLVRRFMMRRYWVMKEFMSARRVGVIVGILPGQYRPGIVDALSKLLRRQGIEYYLLYAERVTRETLDNLGPTSFDAYIITSCPRLAIEDFGDYWKPVLTPGEARIVLMHGGPVDYSFPW